LKDYVEQTDSDSSDLWWICEFYDKGVTPLHHPRSPDLLYPNNNICVYTQQTIILILIPRHSTSSTRHQASCQPPRSHLTRYPWSDLVTACLRL
jgi:hypothetical protein